MKMTKTQLKRIQRRVNSIQREAKDMERKANKGWLTDAEKRCRAKSIAKECMRLSNQCSKFTNCPNTSKYLGGLFLDMAVAAKELAASATKDYAAQQRKSPTIYRKVIK